MIGEVLVQVRNELRALWKIGGPLVVNFLAVAGMGFADAAMAGRIGPRHLAAVSVGTSTWMLGFTFCLGFLMALSPIIARLYGQKRYSRVGRYTRQGFWLSQMLAAAVMLLVFSKIESLYAAAGIDPEFRELTVGYVKAIYCGLPAMTVFLVLRFTSEGIGVTRPVMYVSLFSLFSNVFLNYVLMFGHFGAPALGAVGCGLASAITMWLMTIGLAFHVLTHATYRPLRILSKVAPLRLPILIEILSLGWPIMLTIGAESGLFSAMSILVGTLGTNISAAHQIALNFSASMFMVPLALSAATTVRVGHELGAGDARAARFAANTGVIFGAVFMSCTAIMTFLFRDQVVLIYTADQAVRDIAVGLLFVAAVFQVADGVQISAAGALRGYKDTRVPMLINLFAYWVIGFPAAYVAAKVLKLEPQMIWVAFVLALSVSAVLLSARLRIVSRRQFSEFQEAV